MGRKNLVEKRTKSGFGVMARVHVRAFLFRYKITVIAWNGNECESELLVAGHKIPRKAIGGELGSAIHIFFGDF